MNNLFKKSAVFLLCFIFIGFLPLIAKAEVPAVNRSYYDIPSDISHWVGARYLKSHPGPELVPGDGTFTGAATGWTLGTGWAYSSNTVVKNGDGTGTLSPTTALTITANSIYRVAYTISSMTVSSVTASLGGVTFPIQSDNDSLAVFYVTASSTANLVFTPTNTSRFTIDNISVKKVGTAGTDTVVLFEDDRDSVAGGGSLFSLGESGGHSIRIGNTGIGLGDSANVNHQNAGVANYEYGALGKINSGAGGLDISGYTDAEGTALALNCYVGSEDPTDTTPICKVVASKKSGTTTQALGSGETVFQILNRTTELFTMKGDGYANINGAINFLSQKNIIIVVEGDSISAVPGMYDSQNWPAQVAGLGGIIGKGTIYNYAVIGETAATMVGEYATEAHVVRPAKSSDEGYFFLLAGTNDIAIDTAAAAIYANLQTIWAAARTDGYKVFAFTIPPVTTWTVGNGKETIRLALNALILNDTTLYDGLIRSDILLPAPGNATYYTDGMHPTPTGSLIIANAVYRALDRISPFEVVAHTAYGTDTASYDVIIRANKVGIGTLATPQDTLEIMAAGGGSLLLSQLEGLTSDKYAKNMGELVQSETTNLTVAGTPSELKIKSWNTTGAPSTSSISLWTGAGTPVQRMLISDAGEVILGSNTVAYTPGYGLQIQDTTFGNFLWGDGTVTGSLSSSGGASGYTIIQTNSNHGMVFSTNSQIRGKWTKDGNFLIGTLTAAGTSLAGGLAIGNGTAATGVLANGIQGWSADFLGTGGDARLHIIGEGSVTARLVLGSGKLTNQGTTGGYTKQLAEATATLSGASTTIQTNVPSGSRILGVQLRVDTLITSGDGATSWTAAFTNVPTTAITSGQAFTKNTKFAKITADEISTGEVDITITPNSNTFSGGVIRAIIYYELYDVMEDAA